MIESIAWPIDSKYRSGQPGAMIRLGKGILVALEGVDGSGKTTQTAELARRLTEAGLDVVASKEPTSGKWGRAIRRTATEGRLPIEEELALFMADRREHVETLIRPSLDSGKVVLVDRYYYSTAAYQGARGLDWQKILQDNEAFAPRPDVLVILEVPVDVGLKRVRQRGDEANLFERRESLEACAEIFSKVAGSHVLRVDGTLSQERVTSSVLDCLYRGPLFKRLCGKGYKDTCESEYCSLAGSCSFLNLGMLSPVPSPAWLDEAVKVSADDSMSPQEKVEHVLKLARG